MKTIRTAVLVLVLGALVPAAMARPKPSPPTADAITPGAQALLDSHNQVRRAAGVPPLTWSPALAAGAQQWADRLARSGSFEHSRTPGLGENLAALSPPGRYSMQSFVDLWIGEGRAFMPGRFPSVSRTGNWSDVGHYTQVIWRQTTEVGCGIADGMDQSILVCRYSPAGNVTGETVY